MPKKKIGKDMTLGEIVAANPNAAGVMMGYGLHCIGCPATALETLEQGAKMHGLSSKQIEHMVAEINKGIDEKKKE